MSPVQGHNLAINNHSILASQIQLIIARLDPSQITAHSSERTGWKSYEFFFSGSRITLTQKPFVQIDPFDLTSHDLWIGEQRIFMESETVEGLIAAVEQRLSNEPPPL